jgi:hypothetical protein
LQGVGNLLYDRHQKAPLGSESLCTPHDATGAFSLSA